ncbi:MULTISPECIES: hypothetical protein [Frankia]|uniref:hypothetical protein n=1 Tax=Frankia TaxID=1854 RepID=UPI0002D4EE61|nr:MULTISPECIES: hypothetical protein [Frankia]
MIGQGGRYAGPGGFLQGRGAPKLVGRSRAARDGALARRLWTVSEELTGVTFPLAATKATKNERQSLPVSPAPAPQDW